MRYKKLSGKNILVSAIVWAVIGIIVFTFLGLFIGPVGFIIGPIAGLLFGLAQAGRNVSAKEKEYEETQKLVMQKVQTGVHLTAAERELWDVMNSESNKNSH